MTRWWFARGFARLCDHLGLVDSFTHRSQVDLLQSTEALLCHRDRAPKADERAVDLGAIRLDEARLDGILQQLVAVRALGRSNRVHAAGLPDTALAFGLRLEHVLLHDPEALEGF